VIKATVRKARKPHWCDPCDARSIKVGEFYRSLVVSPYDSEVNSDNPHWWRMKQCKRCAERYDARWRMDDDRR